MNAARLLLGEAFVFRHQQIEASAALLLERSELLAARRGRTRALQVL